MAASFANVKCPACGTATTVPVDALLISVVRDDSDADFLARDNTSAEADPTVAHATWACAACSDLAITQITWPVLLALVNAGAILLEEPDVEDLPEHPERPAGGAAFTTDDVRALHELLASDTWFAELSANPRVNP